MKRLVMMVAGFAIAACGTPSGDGTWEPLAGIGGKDLFVFGFDAMSRPLAGGYGGLRRYSDADGWLRAGTVPDNVEVQALFPADDGGVYATMVGAVYQLPLHATQWTLRLAVTDVPLLVNYVAPDGTLYRRGANDIEMAPAGSATWQTLDPGQDMPAIVDPDHNAYYFPQGQPVLRQAPGQPTTTFVDCATKELFQCSMTLSPIRFDHDGSLLMLGLRATDSITRVYRVPADGSAAKRLAGMPEYDYVYFRGASVTDDGTTYVTSARSEDAYSYGDTWRFSAGDATGGFFFEAPDANVSAAPDGTLYSWIPTDGSSGTASMVGRYVP